MMSKVLKIVGRQGNAGSLKFNSGSKCLLNNNITINRNSYTVSLFVRNNDDYLNNFGSTAILLGFNGNRFNRYFGIFRLNFFRGETNINSEFFSSLTTPFSADWVNISVVFDNGKATTLINGVTIDQRNILNDITINVFGAATNDTSYLGSMSNVRLYDRPLTINEIKLINQGLPISRAGLVGEWKMNEMAGNIAYDTSGNGNNATIYGAIYTTDKPY